MLYSPAAVCLNRTKYETGVAYRKLRGRGALPRASGPPKDGQPPQGLVPTLASGGAAEEPMFLCGIGFPARRTKMKTEEVLPVTATRCGEEDARNEALFDAELFALVTPNV